MFVVIKKKVGTGCRETIQIWTKTNFYPRQDVLEYCSLRCEDFEAGFWSKFKSIWIHFPITPNSKSRSWDASYLKTIWFWEQKKLHNFLFYNYFSYSIKVYWKRKSYLSQGGFDQKVLLPNWVSFETRHQNCALHSVQNINNKGFCQPPRICQNKPSMKNLSKNFVKNLLLVQPFPPDSVLVAQPGSTLLDKTCAGDNVSLSTNFQISSWHKIIKAFASAKEYYLRFSIVKEAVRVRICRSYQNFYFKYTMIFWGNWSLLWN